MSLGDDWFTEIAEDAGSAFSLHLREKLHEEQTPYQTIAIYDTRGFGRLMVIDGCTMLSSRGRPIKNWYLKAGAGVFMMDCSTSSTGSQRWKTSRRYDRFVR